MQWPSIIYSEEVMREGFGIHDRAVPLPQRLALLDALSQTGLKRICVGAFVSPRYVPQMADVEDLLRALPSRDGVKYTTFQHNELARQQAARYSPPLSLDEEMCSLFIDICDVHQRRNVNRTIEQAMAGWPAEIEAARSRGVRRARAGIASAWGSNFQGAFSQVYRMAMLERQVDLLVAAGMDVVELGLHDSQSFCLPHDMEADLLAIKRRWPQIKQFHLHMHDARGMAIPSIYAAIRALDSVDTLLLDGTLGGIGGGQYCGNGAASGMAATEDVMHMLEGMGVATGVDLDRLIDCVWMLEDIIGRPTNGRVSKAGPRPTADHALYDPNLPAVESLEAARHFKLGSKAYEGCSYAPWRHPITGPWYPTCGQPSSNTVSTQE